MFKADRPRPPCLIECSPSAYATKTQQPLPNTTFFTFFYYSLPVSTCRQMTWQPCEPLIPARVVHTSTVVSLKRGNGQKEEKLPRSLWGLTLMIPLQPTYDTAANIKQPEIQANGVLTTDVIQPRPAAPSHPFTFSSLLLVLQQQCVSDEKLRQTDEKCAFCPRHTCGNGNKL